MVDKKRDRRFSISLPVVKEIRLILWAYTRGVSKTRMAEAILIDRVSARCNWDEVCRDLKQEAALSQQSINELVSEVLGQDKALGEAIDLASVNWEHLLTGDDPPEIPEQEEEEE